MKTEELIQREAEIQRAAAEAAAARYVLHELIREARKDGLPLRVIAEAAGMSHEQVRRLTS